MAEPRPLSGIAAPAARVATSTVSSYAPRTHGSLYAHQRPTFSTSKQVAILFSASQGSIVTPQAALLPLTVSAPRTITALRTFSTSALARNAATAAPSSSGSIKPVTFRNYPLRHLVLFPVLHSSIAWTLLGPTYLLLSFTNLTPLLLAGPQGVAVLNTRIPSLVPDGALYGLRDARAVAAKQRPDAASKGITVEEWAEASIRKAAGTTWRTAKGVRDLVSRVRGAAAVPSKLEQAAKDIGEEAEQTGDLAGAASGKRGARGWLNKARDLTNSLGGADSSNDASGGASEGGVINETRGMMRSYISKQTHSVTVRDLADVVGAWVLVKVSRRSSLDACLPACLS